jgi:uncharacterized membrane-anchored protein YitT (DUF2179 family)
MEQYTGVTIISTNSELIRKVLIEKLGYGVTVYKGERGILKEGKVVNQDILYTVISKIELSRIIEVLKSIDDKAFIIINSIHDTRGGVIHKRSL